MGVMTAVARTDGFTRADLDAMPDDGHRHELIDGVIFVTPSPKFIHQNISGNLHLILRNAMPADLCLLMAPFDVVLADDTVVEPDLVLAPRLAYTERDLPVAPMLVVEILSRSTRRIDLHVKLSRYEEAAVGAYWIVDPEIPSVTAYQLMDDVFVEGPVASGDEIFQAAFPFAVQFTPNQLLT